MSSQSPAGPPPETPSAPTHEIGRGLAPARETTTPGTPSPRPEMMLGLWTSWVESISKLASDMGAAPGGLPGQAPWQMSPDQLTGGLKQLGEMAAKDSILARSCARPMTRSTRTRCARLSRWTGRRSPGHCARSGCGPSADPRGRWPPPPISICGRGRLRWTPGTRHGSAGAGWRGPSRRLRAARTSASPRPSGRATLSIAR